MIKSSRLSPHFLYSMQQKAEEESGNEATRGGYWIIRIPQYPSFMIIIIVVSQARYVILRGKFKTTFLLWHSAASVTTPSQIKELMSWLQHCKWTRAFRSYSESSSIIFTPDEHQDWALKWQKYISGMLRCMGVFITTTGLNLTPNNGQQDLMIIAGASLSKQPIQTQKLE